MGGMDDSAYKSQKFSAWGVAYWREKPDALLNHLDISKTQRDLNYHSTYSYIDWLLDFKNEQQQNRFRKLWGIREDYE